MVNNTFNAMDEMVEHFEQHGVMGMHWGERRYQNPDGTLTALGKERFRKVSASDRLTKKENRIAKKVYKKLGKEAKKSSDLMYKISDRQNAKGIKNKEKGLANKAQINFDKSKTYKNMAKLQKKHSEFFNKKVSDIDNNIIQAGKDFIVQKDYNLYAVPGGTIMKKTTTIIPNDNSKAHKREQWTG